MLSDDTLPSGASVHRDWRRRPRRIGTIAVVCPCRCPRRCPRHHPRRRPRRRHHHRHHRRHRAAAARASLATSPLYAWVCMMTRVCAFAATRRCPRRPITTATALPPLARRSRVLATTPHVCMYDDACVCPRRHHRRHPLRRPRRRHHHRHRAAAACSRVARHLSMRVYV